MSVCHVFMGKAICEHGSVKLLKTGSIFCWGRKSDIWARFCACVEVSECVIRVSFSRRLGFETKVCVHLSPAHYSGCVSHRYQCEHTHSHTLEIYSFMLHLCHAHFIICSARQCRSWPLTQHQSINTSVYIRWIERIEDFRTLNPWTPHPCSQQA